MNLPGHHARGFRAKAAGVFDLPRDLALDLSKITLVGNQEMSVTNHRGLDEFRPERLRVKVPGGVVEVTGEGLVIDRIQPEELVVLGKISGITLKEGR